MDPRATPYAAAERRKDGYLGRYRHVDRRRRRTTPARPATSTGSPARGSHQGLTSTSVRMYVRNVVAYPSQYAREAAMRNPTYAARARTPGTGVDRTSEITKRPMRSITIRKYALRWWVTTSARVTGTRSHHTRGSRGSRSHRRRAANARSSPTLAGIGWAVWKTWGIATATNAAARSPAESLCRRRTARRKAIAGMRAASAGATRARDPLSSSPPKDAPVTRKNIPGKYGYVTPHPVYGRATWPVATSPLEIRKYSPTSLPKYTNRVRGESRRTRASARIARREDAVDFRIPRAMGGP